MLSFDRASLPVALTTFIGREREIAEVARLLETAHLVSLVGAGGCGKTRLALRVAGQVAERFAGGVFFVELARIADPALVPQSVAKALNVTEQPGVALLDTLLDALCDKPALLVLDNCEHVLTPCAQLVEALLTCPNLRVLTTSRELMGVVGEALYPVLPMAAPAPARPIDEIRRADAVKLFVARAQSILPHFNLTPDNAETIAAICRDLDGIPLAIELACARVGVLGVKQIHERLARRFDLLVTTNRAIERHRTLRAAIDWSYELLSSSERILLQRLTLFAAGFSLSTAESACAWGAIQRDEVLGLLSSLVGKSLIMAETLQGSEARYRMLETIREYAQEKLRASPEWVEAWDEYLSCYVQLAKEVSPKLNGPYQQLWLNWLETEHDNVRAALAWALEQGHIDAGLRIGGPLYPFWQTRGYAREGLAWLRRLLEQADEVVSLEARVNGLTWASVLAAIAGELSLSIALGDEALALCNAHGEAGQEMLKVALVGAATAAYSAGDHEATYALGRQGLELFRSLDDRVSVGISVMIEGEIALILGRNDEARAWLEESLMLARADGDLYRIAITLKSWADLARCEGHNADAARHYEESLSLYRQIGAAHEIATAQHGLAYALLRLGDANRAESLLRESMETLRAQNDRVRILNVLLGFAALASATGLASDSVRLYAAAVTHESPSSGPRWPPDKHEYEHYLAQARASLSEAEFGAAQTSGRALSLEQAVEQALRLSFPSAAPAQQKSAQTDALSEREREIASLIARGKTNPEIAAELVLSKRTIEKHIANIMSELGFTNRAQIVRWAIEHGLT